MCHVLFIAAVQYTPSSEIATTPPVGSTELPICPVCIGDLKLFLFMLLRGSAIQFTIICNCHQCHI